MLTLCCVALSPSFRDRLFVVCDPILGSRLQQINYQAVLQIAISTVVATSVTLVLTFFYVVWQTQSHLRREGSMISRLYFKGLQWVPWFQGRQQRGLPRDNEEEGERLI